MEAEHPFIQQILVRTGVGRLLAGRGALRRPAAAPRSPTACRKELMPPETP